MILLFYLFVLFVPVGAVDSGSPICPCIDPFATENAEGQKIVPLSVDDVVLVKDGGKCLSKSGAKYPIFFTDAGDEVACKKNVLDLKTDGARGAHYFTSGECGILVDYGVNPTAWTFNDSTSWTGTSVSDGDGTGMVNDATEDNAAVKCFAYWRYAVLKNNNNIRVREDYGVSCDKADYHPNVFPLGYLDSQCDGSASDAAHCMDKFCWIDACTCGIDDASQTTYFIQFPSATKLTYSYRTCSRCHSRSLATCATQTSCAVVNGACVDKTETHSWNLNDCLSRNEHCCGGKLNLGCTWSNAEQKCNVAPHSETYRLLRCPIRSNGREDCKCLSGSANAHLAFGANTCRSWNHIDTLGIDATGNNCVGAHCKDTWCFVNGCSCGSGDAFEVDGIAVSRLTCAQCDVRATKQVCELHTSCEWDQVGFCKEKELDESCSCTSTMCSQHCALKWTADIEQKWRCGKFSVWPETGSMIGLTIFYAHAACRGKLYFHGGKTSELWSFDLTKGRWKMITEEALPLAPQARQGNSMIADEVTNKLYIFGGKLGQVFLNDIWAFDITSETWIRLAQNSSVAPPSRSRPASTLIIVNGIKQLLYYGGHNAGKAFDDWWLYDLATDKWASFVSSGQIAEARVDARLIFLHGYASEPIALLYGGTKYPFENFEFTSGFIVDLAPDDQSCNHFIRLHSLVITADSRFGSPVGRYLASGTPTPDGNHALIAGGWGSAAGVTFGDVWKLELDVYVDAYNVRKFTAQWRCLLPPDPAWPPPNGSAMVNEEYRWGWCGLQGSVVNDHLYLGPGWTEVYNINSIRRVKIAELETQTCIDAPTSIPLRPPPCRFALVKQSFTLKSPKSRYGHGAAVQLGSMYIFGGTDGSVVFDELWRWEGVTWELKPSAPDARSHMVFLAVRDLLWMFGGLLDSMPTAEVWLYDPVQVRWVRNADAPVALSHSCAQVDPDTDTVWIYGGRQSAGFVSNRLWAVDVLLDIWQEKGSWQPRYDCAMHILDGVLTTVLGADANDNTYTDGFFVDLDVPALTFRDVTWPLNAQGKKPPIHGSQLGSVQVGTSLYIVGGKPWSMFFAPHENFVVRFTLNNGDVVAYSTSLCRHTDACCASERQSCWAPPEHKPQIVLSQTSVVHFQNNLVIFGGEEPKGMASADILQIDIATSGGAHHCSPGSYGPTCELCSVGHYGGGGSAATCQPCPLGTSNPNMGAASRSNCRQCQLGSYAGANGTATCAPCKPTETCLVGTKIPIKTNLNTSTWIKQIQVPSNLRRKEDKVQDLLDITYWFTLSAIGASFLVVVAMIWCKGVKWTLERVHFLDFFYQQGIGLQRDGVVYPSILGIFIGMSMLLVFIQLVGQIFWTFLQDNIAETKTIVPTIVATGILEAAERDYHITFHIEILTSISGLTAPCVATSPSSVKASKGKTWSACAGDIRTVYASAHVPCVDAPVTRCRLTVEDVCQVRFVGDKCSLATSTTDIDFVFDHPQAIATEILSEVTVSSSIPLEVWIDGVPDKEIDAQEQAIARLTSRFSPTTGHVFKGTTQPTTLVVLCVPSLYTFGSAPMYKVIHTGLHLDMQNSTEGQQLHSTELSYLRGLRTRITMVLSPMTLVTSRGKEKQFGELVGEAGGAFEIVMIAGVILLIYINVLANRVITTFHNKSGKNAKLVTCRVTISSSSLRLQGQVFFVRCALGTPSQFHLESFDANLTYLSRDLVGRRKSVSSNVNNDNDDDDDVEKCVPLDPLTFEFRLSEQRLDVNLATEFETLQAIMLVLRVQVVESSKSRVLAAAEVDMPKLSDGKVGKIIPLIPPKTAHNSMQSHNVRRSQRRSSVSEPGINGDSGENNKLRRVSILFGITKNRLNMSAGLGVPSFGDLTIELERVETSHDGNSEIMRSISADSLKDRAAENAVELPDDCEPFQNLAECSLAFYNMTNDLSDLQLAINSQSRCNDKDDVYHNLQNSDQGRTFLKGVSQLEKPDGGERSELLLGSSAAGFTQDADLNCIPGIVTGAEESVVLPDDDEHLGLRKNQRSIPTFPQGLEMHADKIVLEVGDDVKPTSSSELVRKNMHDLKAEEDSMDYLGGE